MLDEELILICNTCGILINSLIVRCAICHQPNHEDCTIYDRQEHICPNCRIDTERPNEPTHVSIIEELENDDETLLKCTHSCPDKITNTPGYQVCDIQNADKQVTPEYTTENITSIVQDDLPKINSEKRTKEIRSNDLKLREQKLRKREEELKIREKLNEEMENERIWLQTYVSKLETRVNELERTNKILQQKCELLPNPANDSYSQHDNNRNFHLPSPPKRYIANAMEKMHEKV
jgi:hypothetical protein